MANDDFCFKMEIIQSTGKNPLIVVNFKDGYKNYWKSNNSWVPTLAELEFLYKTKKMSIPQKKNKTKKP